MRDPLLGAVLVGTVVVLIVAGLLAAYELLVYAAHWRPEATELPAGMPYAVGPATGSPAAYLVYLDGIGKMRFRDSRDGGRLTDLLITATPELRILSHVLPYSPLARELAGRWGWRWLRRHAAITLFVYNVLQTFVAADRRYRPLYDRAVGHQIAAQLRGAGYHPDSGVPIVLLSYSGGAQVAIGAVHELHTELTAPLTVITLGGFHDGSGDLTASPAPAPAHQPVRPHRARRHLDLPAPLAPSPRQRLEPRPPRRQDHRPPARSRTPRRTAELHQPSGAAPRRPQLPRSHRRDHRRHHPLRRRGGG